MSAPISLKVWLTFGVLLLIHVVQVIHLAYPLGDKLFLAPPALLDPLESIIIVVCIPQSGADESPM